MSELTSAGVPPIGAEDHVTGEGVKAIVYADFGCPYCAAAWARIRELPLRLCFRHFPMAAKHPRAPALHAAAVAAGLQGGFWEMCDSLYAERGRVDDPHLWERAERSPSGYGATSRAASVPVSPGRRQPSSPAGPSTGTSPRSWQR
jgi:protein-disulfide isomerase